MAGASNMRIVAPGTPDAWCESNEIMVSAICVGGASTAPVTTYSDGAKCGYGDSSAQARIMCAPQGAGQAGPQPSDGGIEGQQGAVESGTGAQTASAGMAAAALRVVSTGSNRASCDPGETLASAFCTGGWEAYPLQTYPGGQVKCGYSGGLSEATAVCMPGGSGASADAGADQSGLRLVASDTNTAYCESGETMVSAYCTGVRGDRLLTYANGAKCGYSGDGGKANVLCSAGSAESGASGDMAAAGLRVASGSNTAFCESDEVMVSAFCTGSWEKYPLITYVNGAKCGYSGGASQVTALCMQR